MKRHSEGEVKCNDQKKIKFHTRKQQFRKEYSVEWPCLRASNLSEGHAFCTVCSCDFSIAHGGRDDCRRHVLTKKHGDYLKSANQNISLFLSAGTDNAVINAESLFARFLIEHNIPLMASDHAGMLFRKMFPDYAIAKRYGSGRTKTTAIVHSMAEMTKNTILDNLKKTSFSIATDASNDISDKKLYPLVVTFFNEADGQMNTTLVSLLESHDSTGEGIFNLLNQEFEALNIKWENCVSFASDNANNMIGKFKGVAAFIGKKYSHIKVIGCSCHLIHRAAQKAAKEALPVDIELLIIQIFYYLEKSSKRKHNLKLYQILCGEKIHKMLKHINTRWLSLEKCLNRLVEQWEPLKCFFTDSGSSEQNSQFHLVKKVLENPVTKLYALFLKNVLCIFTKVNLTLQQEKPCIHILKCELHSLFFDLLVRFVKSSAISKAVSIFSVQYQKEKYQKADDDLVIGSATRTYLGEKQKQFFSSVRKFFCVGCDYVLKKFPLEDEFLLHAEVANVKDKSSKSFKSIKYFVDRFPHLVKPEDLDILEVEFAIFQAEKFSEEITGCDRIDVLWHKISMLTNADGDKKYKVLPKLMLAILTVPHSNAATERIFSMVRKNKTESRSSVGFNTMECLLLEKLNMKSCYSKTFTEAELKKNKSATYMLKDAASCSKAVE